MHVDGARTRYLKSIGRHVKHDATTGDAVTLISTLDAISLNHRARLVAARSQRFKMCHNTSRSTDSAVIASYSVSIASSL
jgi:hypothetical protein